MASETYDYEPFNKTEHSMKQIADAIRHKGYGKDVREAIAQGMEAYDRVSGELFDRMHKVEEKTDQEIKDRKDADKDLQAQIDKANDRLDELDAEKATHDDVERLRDEMYQIRDSWHDRASHIARGTDIETTKAVVEQILQEKGLM